jgi:hypothetical protein
MMQFEPTIIAPIELSMNYVKQRMSTRSSNTRYS